MHQDLSHIFVFLSCLLVTQLYFISMNTVRDGDTYRDVCVQRFAVVFNIRLADVQHVNLRTSHHDPDQGCVFGPSALITCSHTYT